MPETRIDTDRKPFAQCFADLGEKIVLQELGDLIPLRVNDAVNAEIQIRLIEHEEFAQQPFKLLQICLCHFPRSNPFESLLDRPTNGKQSFSAASLA